MVSGGRTQAASSATTAAVAVADMPRPSWVAEFVQWPCRGGGVLRARDIDGAPVWLDPRTERVVALVGELRADAGW
ncbi:hypothetical protein ACIGO9_31620 [Nocardia asteroides]|uniref:hypothetical protein n=1 Tax=Nocardia asteroides TaxID=1824 RepID=UPI0037CC4F99